MGRTAGGQGTQGWKEGKGEPLDWQAVRSGSVRRGIDDGRDYLVPIEGFDRE